MSRHRVSITGYFHTRLRVWVALLGALPTESLLNDLFHVLDFRS